MALLKRRKPWSPRVWDWWSVVLSIYGAFVAAVLALDARLKPSTWTWTHNTKLLITLAALLFVGTVFEAIRRGVTKLGQPPSYVKNEMEIHKILFEVLAASSEVLPVSIKELGCGLFLVQRASRRTPRFRRVGVVFPWLKWSVPKHPEELVRVQRVRLASVNESGVKFVKGKGAVGECWSGQNKHHNDWIAINKRYPTAADVSESRWRQMPAKTTRGFTREEFQSLIGKYAEVLAVPIVKDGLTVGCVALDRKWNKDNPATTCVLDSDKAIGPLHLAAGGVASQLK